MKYQLIYLFAAAFLIRIISLNQSLWLDEATTANVVKVLSYGQILSQYSPTDFHPPLFYFFMKAWTSIFGYSEIALRMPSVLFSLVAGYFVFLTGKFLTNKNAIGFWAAVFFLLNPLVVYYSQEARMYMMVTMLLSMAVYFALRLLRNPENLRHIVYLNILLGLSFAVFYGSIFMIAAIYLLFAVKKEWKLIAVTGPGFLVSLVLLYPLLSGQMAYSKVALTNIANWKQMLGTPSIKNVLLIPVKFSIGRISFDPNIAYYGLGGIASIIIAFFAVRGGAELRKMAFLFVVPLVLAFFFSFNTPLLQYFRFVYLLPILAVMLAFATRNLITERAVVFGIFGLATFAYLFTSAFHREDWKHALISAPQSIPVYMIPMSTDPVTYYYPERKTRNLLDIDKVAIKEKEVIVIPYTAEIYGLPYEELMQKQKFTLEQRIGFTGFVVDYWRKQ